MVARLLPLTLRSFKEEEVRPDTTSHMGGEGLVVRVKNDSLKGADV